MALRRGQGARLRPRLRARARGRAPSGRGSAGRRRSGLVLSRRRARRGRRGAAPPASTSEALARGGRPSEEDHEEELFGPAEGLHATYRTLREQVLEASWRAGRELSEPRLDTAIDVNRAIARYLELLKLAALAQRPGDEPTAEAIEAVNGLLRQVATPEQQAELDASSLDAYLLDSEHERGRRRELIAAREEPSLEAFLPRRGDGRLSLSASDLEPLPDLPAEVQVRARLRDPAGADDQPALRDPHPQRARALPQGAAGERTRTGCARLTGLFETGWRRTGFGTTDDELQFRDRAREALRLYWERERVSEGEPVWLERKFDFKVGEHHVRGRVDRVDRLPDGDYELIDYKTGERKHRGRAGERPAAGALPARRPRGLGHRGQHRQLLLRARRRQGRGADQARRRRAGRAHRARRSARGCSSQDFEPRPSPQRLQLVRLPADLPGGRELSRGRRSSGRRRAGAGSAGTRGRSCRRRAAPRPRRRAGRPVRPRSARPAPRSPGWRRPRGRSAPRSRSVSSSSSEASTAIPVRPSSRRSSASAAFGLGTAAT